MTADASELKLSTETTQLRAALGSLGFVLADDVKLDASTSLLPLLQEISERRVADSLEIARLRKALERIVLLKHDKCCPSQQVPLEECGCYERSRFQLAEAALAGIDWEPASRKERALTHVTVDDDLPDEPYWRCYRILHTALSRLDEAVFETVSLEYRHVIRMAVGVASETELAELRRLAAASEVEDAPLAEILGEREREREDKLSDKETT